MTAAMEVPDSGVDLDEPGQTVLWVLPGGTAWHSGIHEGQSVVEIITGDSPLDWVMHTHGPVVDYYLSIRSATNELRGTLPLALAALLIAVLASPLALRRPRAAAAAACLAGMIASIPLMFGGNSVISSIGGLLMVALPVAWLVAFVKGWRPLRVAILGVGIVVAVAWLASRFVLPSAYGLVDTARIVLVAVAGLAIVGLSVDRATIQAAVASLDGPMAIDLLGLALVAGVALSLWLVLEVSPLVIAALCLPLAVVYARSRRPIARLLEQRIFGERLERASVAGVEAERGRLARDIHDEPLQELSGVIRRLDTNPAASAEATALRDVAEHLRAVATDLRPPVLEDLGLGPAIASLAQQANTNGSAVRALVTLDDRTGIARTARLPADVEVALFRIVQEALSNAQLHSGGTQVEVTGQLTPEQADLTIRDDGVGVADRAIQDGRRRGRLGMASMRDRAAAIGAAFSVGSAGASGTSVQVHWGRA